MTVDLAAEARRLRVEEGLSAAQIRQRLGVGKDRLRGWLRGVPPPAWTRRPNAKDDLRERAVAMRGAGASVDEIAGALCVAKSTAYRWVRHLPLHPDPQAVSARRRAAAEARWSGHRQQRDGRRAAVALDAEEAVGTIGVRELLMIGAVMYWCEGAKSKPWREQQRIQFINSDIGLLRLFLAFLEAVGVRRVDLSYRVSIHESADVDAAVEWWSTELAIPATAMRRPTIKRHAPATARRNTGESYRGCLVITVPRGRELYWWIEGAMAALAAAVEVHDPGKAIHPDDATS